MQDMTRNLRYLLVLLFVSVAGTAFAQQPGAITGTVLDEKKEPLKAPLSGYSRGMFQQGGE